MQFRILSALSLVLVALTLHVQAAIVPPSAEIIARCGCNPAGTICSDCI
jgi:hypothetical protein